MKLSAIVLQAESLVRVFMGTVNGNNSYKIARNDGIFDFTPMCGNVKINRVVWAGRHNFNRLAVRLMVGFGPLQMDEKMSQ